MATFSSEPSTYQVLNAAVPGIPNLSAMTTELAPTNNLAVGRTLQAGWKEIGSTPRSTR